MYLGLFLTLIRALIHLMRNVLGNDCTTRLDIMTMSAAYVSTAMPFDIIPLPVLKCHSLMPHQRGTDDTTLRHGMSTRVVVNATFLRGFRY